MSTPNYALASWTVEATYGGQVVVLTLACGQRFAVKSASMGDDVDDGVLLCEHADGRELLVVIGAIVAAEEQG